MLVIKKGPWRKTGFISREHNVKHWTFYLLKLVLKYVIENTKSLGGGNVWFCCFLISLLCCGFFLYFTPALNQNCHISEQFPNTGIVPICVNAWWEGKQMNQMPDQMRRGDEHKFEKLEFLGLWKEKLLTVLWLIPPHVTQRGCTISLGILENHLDMIPLEQGSWIKVIPRGDFHPQPLWASECFQSAYWVITWNT